MGSSSTESMIGSIVYATEQGLGRLAKSFFDHGVVNKVLIYPHSSRFNHPDWYGDKARIYSIENIDWLLEGLDTMLYFEEPFNWKIIPTARDRGIKNVFMPMYECTRYPMPYEPDTIICPSLLDLEYYKEKNAVFLPVPVDLPWKERKKAEVFIHNAGNGGLGGRNGTKELLYAMEYVKSPIKLIIRTQEKQFSSDDPRVEIRYGTVPFEELYNEGDVFVFPEKFNGLSLPLQEAFASGMLVMCGNRFPVNTWLPVEPMIPVHLYTKERIAVNFDCAQYDPKRIAATIDAWYGKDITAYSLKGKLWGQKNHWRSLKKEYLKICAK